MSIFDTVNIKATRLFIRVTFAYVEAKAETERKEVSKISEWAKSGSLLLRRNISTDVVRYGHPVRQSSQGVLASMSTDLTSKNNREFIDHGPKCTNHHA